eukprot:2705242-Pyramimonas_sp.AAC.1
MKKESAPMGAPALAKESRARGASLPPVKGFRRPIRAPPFLSFAPESGVDFRPPPPLPRFSQEGGGGASRFLVMRARLGVGVRVGGLGWEC